MANIAVFVTTHPLLAALLLASPALAMFSSFALRWVKNESLRTLGLLFAWSLAAISVGIFLLSFVWIKIH